MTPQDPAPTAPRRLVRPTDDRLVAGVAAGLGRHFDLDPALIRVAFVVLAVLGLSGLAIYVVLWLILPSEDAPARIRTDSPTSHKVALAALGVLVIVSLPVTTHGFLPAGPAFLVLAVLAALGVLLWRAVGGEGAPSVTRIALMVLAVAGAAVLGAGAGLAAAFGGGTWVAVAVIVLGVALVAGGFVGGARWLIVPAVVMAIPLTVVSASDIDLTGGVGGRDYRPSSMDDLHSGYRLGVGEMQLDLRGVDLPAGTTRVRLAIGVGRVQVTVPATACVQSVAHVGVGHIERFGRSDDGIDVRVDHRPRPALGAPVLLIDADAGMGEIVVSHEPSASGDWPRRGGDGPERQPACRA